MPKAKIDPSENVEALKGLIRDTQNVCGKDGLALCAYFLELAALSLDDDSQDIDSLLHHNVNAPAGQSTHKAP